ncbi:MAG: phosphatase PAP2 family protein [Acidimicrobiales bacterium]
MLYAAYSAVRDFHGHAISPADYQRAFRDARSLIALERHLHIGVEHTFQTAAMHATWLVKGANVFYGSAHFLVTTGVLAWLYRYRRERYRRWRLILLVATATALIGFIAFPVAPPRMLPSGYGFTDTLHSLGGLWTFNSGVVERISDPFAAMPSLHLCWAVWCAAALWPVGHRRGARALLISYPLFTAAVVLITGNHYVLDVVAGAACVAVGVVLTRRHLISSPAVSNWNFADVWETVAETLPSAPATVHGPICRDWAELDRRADAIGAWLLDAGIAPGTTFAQYLYSGPEYVESVFASFKLGIPPVNTNYRYGGDELAYLWDNADAAAVIFHATFTQRIEAVRSRVPGVRAWLWVDDGTDPRPSWAQDYEDVVGNHAGRVAPPWGRSPDDLYLLYTGGTTGMPKGVMWRQDDLFSVLNRTAAVRYPEDGGVADVRTLLVKPGPSHVPCAPLMHGTGAFTSMAALSSGGSVVTLTGRSFDAAELLDTIARERVRSTAIVGDAFAKPILAALDAEPGRWDISSLKIMTSSGVMWSRATKDGLLRHHPQLLCVDTLGSSEAINMASSVATTGEGNDTAAFALGPDTRVVTDDGRDVVAGSGEVGIVALAGRMPVGYYKDEAKSAATFRLLDGRRWSIPGDFATVEADGSLRLLGRGSQCINTGGEKVYPEEVEEAIKTHPAAQDAVCVGVPDERFGEAVVALVELAPGAVLDEADLIAHVKGRLAAYKAPKRVVAIETVGRAANGKVDYKALQARALDLTSR